MKSNKTNRAIGLLDLAVAMAAEQIEGAIFNSANTTQPNDYSQTPGNELRIQQAAVKIWRGTAVGVIMGTGYATPLVVATAGMQFVGIAEETSDNTLGTPGTLTYGTPGNGYSPFVRVARKGEFAIDGIAIYQSGTAIAEANIGNKVFWLDNQTVTLTPGTSVAGVLTRIDENGYPWFDIQNSVFQPAQDGWVPLTGSADALSPNVSANYIVNSTGVDAMTLAAPTAVVDDGKTIIVSSNGAHAHTITATGLLQTGSASVNVATFAAHAGAGLTLKAYNGYWNVISEIGITFS
jgi:hypothetical protein